MPRKIRQAVNEVQRNRFFYERCKGSHRTYRHPSGLIITLSGGLGDDVKDYQEKHIVEQIRKAQQWEAQQ